MDLTKLKNVSVVGPTGLKHIYEIVHDHYYSTTRIILYHKRTGQTLVCDMTGKPVYKHHQGYHVSLDFTGPISL